MLKRLLAALAVALAVFALPASAATLLPNGEQTFLDANGAPLAAGQVWFYIPGTGTPKTTWQDPGQTIPNTNPVILDAGGRAIIYGAGAYQQLVKDYLGNIIWNQLTADTAASGSSFGGTSTGSANSQTVLAGGFTSGDGQSITFVAGFTNTSSLAITPSGASPIAVLKDTPTGPTALTGFEVVAGNVVTVVYSAATGNFHLVTPPFFQAPGPLTTLTASGTVDLGTVSGHNVAVSGTTTTTSFGSSAALSVPVYWVLYTGAGPWVITQSSAILIPGGANLSLNTFDNIALLYLGSGNWRVLAVNRATGNRLILNQILTIVSTGTYTAPANLAFDDAACVGGGGGGGGSGGSTTAGGGGGGGEIAEGEFTAAQIGAAQAVTIGAPGTGSAGGNGTGGTGTSFGALLTCLGGSGGSAGNGAPGLGGNGGAGGSIRTPGASGGTGTINGTSSTYGGFGGAGYNGVGGGAGIAASGAGAGSAGNAGLSYGAGGGGSATVTSGASEAGGNGLKGALIIKEWVYAP